MSVVEDTLLSRPKPTRGMRHVALYVQSLEECEHFYVDLLGMQVEWRPDADNVYLTSGNDNVALHRAPANVAKPSSFQRLDHIGFVLEMLEDVDVWFEFLRSHNVRIRNEPKTHRDGARSFYCFDPDGTVVQMIYHPPISTK